MSMLYFYKFILFLVKDASILAVSTSFVTRYCFFTSSWVVLSCTHPSYTIVVSFFCLCCLFACYTPSQKRRQQLQEKADRMCMWNVRQILLWNFLFLPCWSEGSCFSRLRRTDLRTNFVCVSCAYALFGLYTFHYMTVFCCFFIASEE